MIVEPLDFDGVFLVTLDPRRDERGHFIRLYDREILARHRLDRNWVQENEALSTRRHIVRGLHFQRPPAAETKLIRCVLGAIWDVFVDLRAGSPSFGLWSAVELVSARPSMLFLPPGFAHGYCTLSETTLVSYKVDAAYAPSLEGALRWNDRDLGIPWPARAPILSARDASAPGLAAIAPIVLSELVTS